MDKPVIQIDFKKRPSYVHLGKGVYQNPSNGRLFERPTVNGTQTFRRLNARTIRAAQIELGNRRAKQAMAREGLARDPYLPASESWTVSKMLDFYLQNGCPSTRKKTTGTRTEKNLKPEKARVETLRQWWGKKQVDTITLEHCARYHEWRIARIRRGAGHRQVDKELVTLSNAFRLALRNYSVTGISKNPIAHDRERFCCPTSVKHCRDFQPRDADELHGMARYLFGHPKSEVLGWVALFQAYIGQRVSEILRLRWDARSDHEPGFRKGKVLWLYRSNSTKGTYSHAVIHPALKQCLEAHAIWHQLRFSKSPWFFPSPEDPRKHVGETALTHALRRIAPLMGLPNRTSHGLRSFFVNVMRSQGMSDSEIALRIGHRTGGKLIVDVYGEIRPDKITFLPEGPLAWEKWLQPQARPQIVHPETSGIQSPAPLQLEFFERFLQPIQMQLL